MSETKNVNLGESEPTGGLSQAALGFHDHTGFRDNKSRFHSTPVPIGQMLIRDGLLTDVELAGLLTSQRASGLRIGEEMIGQGRLRPLDLYRTLASQHGLPFINLMSEPPDTALLDAGDLDLYLQGQLLPWRRVKGTLVFVAVDPRAAGALLREHLSEPVFIYQTSSFDILWTVQRAFSQALTERACFHLHETNPSASAKILFSSRDRLSCLALVCALIFVTWFFPQEALAAANFFTAVAFLLLAGLRLFSLRGAKQRRAHPSPSWRADADLPTYSILVPMLREAEVLPILVDALVNLDYPTSKLDIKLVLEADDAETINAARLLKLPGNIEIILVPPSQPMTKPKACNYALPFTRGELLVVFDAEDIPDPQQLREAVSAFDQGGVELACVQAPLAYYNWSENWLTRHFAIEYAAIFDLLLPSLAKLKLPFPLGGTSTHFRTDALRRVGAWDPFNVTEDADLGFRLFEAGYATGTIQSTTLEEANCHTPNWIRQRSRWLKGWMQTYLVRMRHPVQTVQQIGFGGFLVFQIVIGAFLLSALLHPLFYILIAYALHTSLSEAGYMSPGLVGILNAGVLVVGFGATILAGLVGAVSRQLSGLRFHALTMPFYWLLISFAAYKALWQLIMRPHYWEKTVHGISAFSPTLAHRAQRLREKQIQKP